MTEVKELTERFYALIHQWWAKSLVLIILILIAFAFGRSFENKQITDDCKFMGSFRDGTQAYSCQVRIK